MSTIPTGRRQMQRMIQMCILAVFAWSVVAVAQTPAPGTAPADRGQAGAAGGRRGGGQRGGGQGAVAYGGSAQGQGADGDWPNFTRYRAANAALPPPASNENRVVFMGDSITDFWARQPLFQNKSYVNRGIGAQTTPQMLLRFRADVINLQPKVVVILAGINDIAGNSGPSTPEMIEDNFKSMVELAQENHIKVVLSSIMPADKFPWNPNVNPVPIINQVNAWMKDFAAQRGCVYLDYYTAMVDENSALKKEYQSDAVHPNAAGYVVMGQLAEKAIPQALAMK